MSSSSAPFGAARRRSASAGKGCSTRWGTGAWPWRWARRAFATGHRPRAYPAGQAVVFCSNHQSNVDPPVLFRALHRAPAHPVQGRAAQASGAWPCARSRAGSSPVRRENRDAAFASIEQAADSIRAGNSFLIFPEGTRSKTDELLPVQERRIRDGPQGAGAGRPGGHHGGREAMHKGSAVVRPVHVTVRIGHASRNRRSRRRMRRTPSLPKSAQRIEALLRQGPAF